MSTRENIRLIARAPLEGLLHSRTDHCLIMARPCANANSSEFDMMRTANRNSVTLTSS